MTLSVASRSSDLTLNELEILNWFCNILVFSTLECEFDSEEHLVSELS